jgi:hypothetical protein
VKDEFLTEIVNKVCIIKADKEVWQKLVNSPYLAVELNKIKTAVRNVENITEFDYIDKEGNKAPMFAVYVAVVC